MKKTFLITTLAALTLSGCVIEDAPYHGSYGRGPAYHGGPQPGHSVPTTSSHAAHYGQPAPHSSVSVAAGKAYYGPYPVGYTVLTARPVPGQRGFVYSPYSTRGSIVDVRSIRRGSQVRCPHTDRIFLYR